MKLILVRHGETSWNVVRRIQGGSQEVQLNHRGQEQAQKVALALRRERLEAIYSSPRERALDTARAIAEPHNLEVFIKAGLREIETGLVGGMTVEECHQAFPQFWKEWREGIEPLRWPGGESLAEVVDRVKPVVAGIRQRHSTGTVVVVSHIYTMSALLLWALGLRLNQYPRLRLEPASITVLRWDGERPALALFNDTCHWR